MNEFTWLACSNFYNGVFCEWCVAFAPQTVSRSAKPPSSLVSGPHCNYKKAKEHYSNHQNCHYHKLRVAMFDNFVQTNADKSRDVRNALNSSRQTAVEKNRNRLSHMRTIEFCGRQEIPFRGHRDAGAFSLNETDCNDGVFKAALTLRLEAADKQTSDLFLKTPCNASYLSWRVQNQIISFFMYLFHLTTTSGRPEPERTLRRVMSSESVQDEQLTRDCKQSTSN